MGNQCCQQEDTPHNVVLHQGKKVLRPETYSREGYGSGQAHEIANVVNLVIREGVTYTGQVKVIYKSAQSNDPFESIQSTAMGTPMKQEQSPEVTKTNRLMTFGDHDKEDGQNYDDLFRQKSMLVPLTYNQRQKINNKIYIKHGQGLERYSPDKFYEGYFVNDMKHGYGEEMYDINTTFKGMFEHNKKVKGEIYWGDTFSKYEGEFRNDVFSGQGKYTYPDGREYVGQFSNNMMNGLGRFTWRDGKIYEGEFKDGLKHGKGVHTWPEGKAYSGMWAKGHMHGKGTYMNKKGERREGLWKDGKRIQWTSDILE